MNLTMSPATRPVNFGRITVQGQGAPSKRRLGREIGRYRVIEKNIGITNKRTVQKLLKIIENHGKANEHLTLTVNRPKGMKVYSWRSDRNPSMRYYANIYTSLTPKELGHIQVRGENDKTDAQKEGQLCKELKSQFPQLSFEIDPE